MSFFPFVCFGGNGGAVGSFGISRLAGSSVAGAGGGAAGVSGEAFAGGAYGSGVGSLNFFSVRRSSPNWRVA